MKKLFAAALLSAAIWQGHAAPAARAERLYDLSPQPMERIAQDVGQPQTTVVYQSVLVTPDGQVQSFMWGGVPMHYDSSADVYRAGNGQLTAHAFFHPQFGEWRLAVTTSEETRIFRFLD